MESLEDGSLYERISNGKFDDLYVGNYIVKNNVTWRIAGFDLHYSNKGYETQMVHHAVIVPDNSLGNANMNDADTTFGGYIGSKMYKETLPMILDTIITPVFGTHVLEYSNLLTNNINETGYNRTGVNTGCSNGWQWEKRKLDLMSEVQLVGTIAMSSGNVEIGSDTTCFPLFKLASKYVITMGNAYWLRNISTASTAVIVFPSSAIGDSYTFSVHGIRPYFYIG